MALVLIADDVSISRETLSRVLRDAGHRVIAATSGAEAVAAARTERPDLAILDLNMPRMSGTEAAVLIKAEFPGQFFPVLIVSGRTFSSSELAPILDAAEDFLRKPYTPVEVCARVEVWLRIRRRFQELRAALAQPSAESAKK